MDAVALRREPGLLGIRVGVAAALWFGAYWLNRPLWDFVAAGVPCGVTLDCPVVIVREPCF